MTTDPFAAYTPVIITRRRGHAHLCSPGRDGTPNLTVTICGLWAPLGAYHDPDADAAGLRRLCRACKRLANAGWTTAR